MAKAKLQKAASFNGFVGAAAAMVLNSLHFQIAAPIKEGLVAIAAACIATVPTYAVWKLFRL